MIDTQETGAGSYPSAPEDIRKQYEFELYATVKITGIVLADTEKEAEELIEQKEWDEIIQQKIDQIEWIKDIKEVKE